MRKPDKLRAHFTALFPDWARDPNRLRMWVEEGQVQCRASANLSYQLEYRLIIIIEGYGRDGDGNNQSTLLIWIALIDWLRIHQPELLAVGADPGAIRWEADHVATDATDISIELRLREAVKVMKREDGGFDMCVVDEPDPMFPCDKPLLEPVPLLKQIHAPGEEPWKEHLVEDPRPIPIEPDPN